MRRYIPRDAKLIPENAERVFQGVIYDVYQWDQEMFDGSTARYEMLRRPDTVEVICIDGDEVVLIDEEQPHRGRVLTVPGGRADEPDEDELDAAKREVLEEVGMKFANWKLVHARQFTTKIEHMIYTFVADGLIKETEPALDSGGEKITMRRVQFDEFSKLMHDKALRTLFPDFILDANSLDEIRKLPDLYEN